MLAVVRLGAVHSLVFGGINIKKRNGRVLFPLGRGRNMGLLVKNWVMESIVFCGHRFRRS